MSSQPDTYDTPVISSAAHVREYFVPRDGISHAVISAEIRFYLGNDTLVQPGNYVVCDGRIFSTLLTFVGSYANRILASSQNSLTGRNTQGYYVFASGYLTTVGI
jgi:hypothetical protein